MVGRIDAHGEAIGGLARARQRVELGDECAIRSQNCPACSADIRAWRMKPQSVPSINAPRTRALTSNR